MGIGRRGAPPMSGAVMRRAAGWIILSCLAAPARAQPPLCSVLPQDDVIRVLSSPVKLTESAIETSKTGAGTIRTQRCNYDSPAGTGIGPATVRVTVSQAASPSAAAEIFMVRSQTLRPMIAVDAEPLSGVGDEAVVFQKSGTISMRKSNVLLDVSVTLRDLNREREITLGKELVTTAAGRIR
jgi:hypothetical protein